MRMSNISSGLSKKTKNKINLTATMDNIHIFNTDMRRNISDRINNKVILIRKSFTEISSIIKINGNSHNKATGRTFNHMKIISTINRIKNYNLKKSFPIHSISNHKSQNTKSQSI